MKRIVLTRRNEFRSLSDGKLATPKPGDYIHISGPNGRVAVENKLKSMGLVLRDPEAGSVYGEVVCLDNGSSPRFAPYSCDESMADYLESR